MVRLLLLSSFFLGTGVWAHDSNGTVSDCERALNPPQIRTYAYLRKLQAEADATELPQDQYFRVAIGRAVGPLVAALSAAGSQITSVPLKLNLPQGLVVDGQAVRVLQILTTYFPTAKEIGNKKVAVIMYAEEAKQVLAVQQLLITYLDQLGIPAERLLIRVYTSQMYLRHLERDLGVGDAVTFRPISHHNEVRHWFHDGMRGIEKFDVSQYVILDSADPAQRIPVARGQSRPEFENLRNHL